MPGKCIWCFVTSKAKRKKDQGFLFWKYVCWVELCPQKRNVEVLTPGTYDYDLIYSLSRCKHEVFWVGSKPIWLVSLWRGNRGTGTIWRRTDTEERQPAADRGRDRLELCCYKSTRDHQKLEEGDPKRLKGVWPCQHPDFGLLASRILRQ